jgi:hypothetical protein
MALTGGVEPSWTVDDEVVAAADARARRGRRGRRGRGHQHLSLD